MPPNGRHKENEMNEKQIKSANDSFQYLKSFARKKQEHFIVMTVNAQLEVIRKRITSIGTLNRTLVHPRDVFRGAIVDNAYGIIVCHNHPSGSLEASKEDLDITRRLKNAGELLGIPVLDHLIVSKRGYYSLIHDV